MGQCVIHWWWFQNRHRIRSRWHATFWVKALGLDGWALLLLRCWSIGCLIHCPGWWVQQISAATLGLLQRHFCYFTSTFFNMLCTFDLRCALLLVFSILLGVLLINFLQCLLRKIRAQLLGRISRFVIALVLGSRSVRTFLGAVSFCIWCLHHVVLSLFCSCIHWGKRRLWIIGLDLNVLLFRVFIQVLQIYFEIPKWRMLARFFFLQKFRGWLWSLCCLLGDVLEPSLLLQRRIFKSLARGLALGVGVTCCFHVILFRRRHFQWPIHHFRRIWQFQPPDSARFAWFEHFVFKLSVFLPLDLSPQIIDRFQILLNQMNFILNRAILLLILVGSSFEACMLVFFAWPCQNIQSRIIRLIWLIWLIIRILVLEIPILVAQCIVTQLYASLLVAWHQRIRPACGFILWVVEGVILECVGVWSLVWHFARTTGEMILHNAVLVQRWFNVVDAIIELIDI